MKPLYHNIKLKSHPDAKDFWQKVWLAQRYVESLGFRKRNMD